MEAERHLLVKKRGSGTYDVSQNTKAVFQVKPFDSAFMEQLILIDCSTMRVAALLRRQCCSGKWNAYRGLSTAESDLLFSIKKKSWFLSKIFGGSKQSMKGRIRFTGEMNKVDFGKEEFTALVYPNVDCARIYVGDVLKAEMRRMDSDKDKFTVTVCPREELAHMISVFAIIEAMSGSNSSSLDKNQHLGLGDVAQALGVVAEVLAAGVSGFTETVMAYQEAGLMN